MPRLSCGASEPVLSATTCVINPGYTSEFPDVLYDSGYGATCKTHLEPGHTSCFNVTHATPLPVGVRAGWCAVPFCYIDPRNCDAPDVATV